MKLQRHALLLYVFIFFSFEVAATEIKGYGKVFISPSEKNEIIHLETTLHVPTKPNPIGTLFLWPGLQPTHDGRNFLPIDNGVLQPVLTWGPSCVPGVKPASYSTWWISAQYVNTRGHYSGYTHCHSGPIMKVNSGDSLFLDMSLVGTKWTQIVLNLGTKESIKFEIDLLGQAQNYAEFIIEKHQSAEPKTDVLFTNTTITFSHPDPSNCKIRKRGMKDEVTVPILLEQGKKCQIKTIVLRSNLAAET